MNPEIFLNDILATMMRDSIFYFNKNSLIIFSPLYENHSSQILHRFQGLH